MERIKRFCNALFFMAYILFLTIVFQKFICSFHGIDTNIVHYAVASHNYKELFCENSDVRGFLWSS